MQNKTGHLNCKHLSKKIIALETMRNPKAHLFYFIKILLFNYFINRIIMNKNIKKNEMRKKCRYEKKIHIKNKSFILF